MEWTEANVLCMGDISQYLTNDNTSDYQLTTNVKTNDKC